MFAFPLKDRSQARRRRLLTEWKDNQVALFGVSGRLFLTTTPAAAVAQFAAAPADGVLVAAVAQLAINSAAPPRGGGSFGGGPLVHSGSRLNLADFSVTWVLGSLLLMVTRSLSGPLN